MLRTEPTFAQDVTVWFNPMFVARCRPCLSGTLPKGTPLEDGLGADPSKLKKAVKIADKLGERIARTTDKIMEMRKDVDGKQVGAASTATASSSSYWHSCFTLMRKNGGPQGRPRINYL